MTGETVLSQRIQSLGIPVFHLNMKRGFPDPRGFINFIRILLKEKPAILQTWLYHAGLLGVLGAKIANIKSLVWNIRCSELNKEDHPRSLFWIIWIMAKLSKMPEAVIVNSSSGRLCHENLGYKPRHWETIFNGFDTGKFCPSHQARFDFRKTLNLEPRAPLIGLVARYHPMKDHRTFLKAASLLYARKPNVHYVLAGDGITINNRELVRDIEGYQLSEVIHLLGERLDVHKINAALDIASCASYSEGFPNIIGEAMACGIPCVSTGVGDASFLIGNTGRIVPSRDPDAMADAWTDLLSMEEEDRKALGKSARERIVSLFSMEKIAKQYEELYCKINEAYQ